VSTSSPETHAVQERLDAVGADQLLLAGVNDAHLAELARLTDSRVILRGDHLILSGSQEAVEQAVPVARRMIELARRQKTFSVGDLERFFKSEPAAISDAEQQPEALILPRARKLIRPRSDGQREYLDSIRDNDIAVGIGPAGTGKTYLAVAKAVEALHLKRVRRIILTRPAVEAGEALGFLPGDIREKVDPYLRPLYDALEDMMPANNVRRAIEDYTIEIAPLAYMRGRTLSDAFLILDEAQNATTAQMKMFLTRLGLNSKTVITGDKTQIDLPRRIDSGLLEIEEILKGIEGIDFVYMTELDVVRHRLVKEIIRAYGARTGQSDDSSEAGREVDE
jgi:phosphate starvation-inducible PhoH-like protein